MNQQSKDQPYDLRKRLSQQYVKSPPLSALMTGLLSQYANKLMPYNGSSDVAANISVLSAVINLPI